MSGDNGEFWPATIMVTNLVDSCQIWAQLNMGPEHMVQAKIHVALMLFVLTHLVYLVTLSAHTHFHMKGEQLTRHR